MVGRTLRYYIALMAGVLMASIGMGLSRLALAKMLRDDMGASVLLVSSLTTWFMLARAVSSALSGFWALSSERAWRLLLSLPLMVVSLSVYLMGGLVGIAGIMVLNAVWGFMNGLVWPQAQAVASILFPRLSGSSVAIYFAIGTLGMSMGQYIYGVTSLPNPSLVRLSSIAFLASALSLAVVAARVPPPRSGDSAGRRGFRLAGVGVVSAWIILAAYAAGYSGGVLREFLYVYLGEVFNLAREELGSILALSGIVGLLVGLAVGPASDRLGTSRVLAFILFMGAIGNLALGMAASPLTAFIGLALAYSSSRSSMPLTRNLRAFNHPHALALLGLSNTSSNIGQMTGPLISGKLYDMLQGKTLIGIPGEAIPFILVALLLAATLVIYLVCVAGRHTG